ncbi:hypothetical protein M501DRAFT_252998 [Patellaria atrata CBS 101060]|uniref:Uncharacterized protein n=1 Tax=Patellaria atrata CBS 101060 TaxID=1346257 RepID=A0A9P4S7F4_9PEZI|nr:hypothetical protein M501DRAFT_252998 [Patellaria atrata CBS 101060]
MPGGRTSTPSSQVTSVAPTSPIFSTHTGKAEQFAGPQPNSPYQGSSAEAPTCHQSINSSDEGRRRQAHGNSVDLVQSVTRDSRASAAIQTCVKEFPIPEIESEEEVESLESEEFMTPSKTKRKPNGSQTSSQSKRYQCESSTGRTTKSGTYDGDLEYYLKRDDMWNLDISDPTNLIDLQNMLRQPLPQDDNAHTDFIAFKAAFKAAKDGREVRDCFTPKLLGIGEVLQAGLTNISPITSPSWRR